MLRLTSDPPSTHCGAGSWRATRSKCNSELLKLPPLAGFPAANDTNKNHNNANQTNQTKPKR